VALVCSSKTRCPTDTGFGLRLLQVEMRVDLSVATGGIPSLILDGFSITPPRTEGSRRSWSSYWREHLRRLLTNEFHRRHLVSAQAEDQAVLLHLGGFSWTQRAASTSRACDLR